MKTMSTAKTIIKLFLMSHSIPVIISNPDALKFYKTVAKLHGMQVSKVSYGFLLT